MYICTRNLSKIIERCKHSEYLKHAHHVLASIVYTHYIQCTSYIVCRTLYVVHCMSYIVCRTLYVVHCMTYIVCRTLYVVHCMTYIV